MLLKKSHLYFRYPVNLNVLDLASLVSMYRKRGEPVKAAVGEFFYCTATNKLVKSAKWWFGLHYSQEGWDATLTKGSEGYPLTETELNIMGLIRTPLHGDTRRSFIESKCGINQQLAFMIVNDLKQFGFIDETEEGELLLSSMGDKALDGFARRVYDKKFMPEMLIAFKAEVAEPEVPKASKKSDQQIDMF